MFLENAITGKNQFWRYLVSTIVIFIGLIIGQLPLGVLLVFEQMQGTDISGFEKNMDFSLIGIDPNLGLALIILSFIGGFFALIIAVKFIHNKNFKDVITSHSKIQWNKVFWAFGLWMALSIFAEIGFYYNDTANYTYQFNLELFIPLVLVSLLLMPFQTSFEEIFIRGYLMQGIGMISVFRIIPLIITSLIFGGLHIMNPEIESFGLGVMMAFYVGFGLVMGIITIMDDGLELPLGIHAANNIYASVFVTYAGGALQTSAIFKVEKLDQNLMVIGWAVISVIFIFWAAKKYGWQNWSKLLGRIDFK
ncbi:MAG: CPBP family intramembrane metalloprotease [Calditrichaeota bacterium]|nr:MAG: CPBP family intramembrane metalloprotease [Calditrichota bacterium]MBL1205813.1 CPBP family intramembrane metalloprotease [Calditrichota bacterium]NOG45641.1 CPBP family intramembrane metalloprotease [Calditrichota bacterium]